METTEQREPFRPDYARPGAYQPSRGLVRVAAICGALPLASACAIYATWVVTRKDQWAMLGLFNIWFGVILFIVGAACLLGHFATLRAEADRPFRRFFATSWIAILLLLINFPTAALMIWSADYVDRTFPAAKPSHSDSFAPGLHLPVATSRMAMV